MANEVSRRDFAKAGAVVGLGSSVPVSACGWCRGSGGRDPATRLSASAADRRCTRRRSTRPSRSTRNWWRAATRMRGGSTWRSRAPVAAGRPAPALYAAADFDRMVAEAKPALVVVTTPCGTHHQLHLPRDGTGRPTSSARRR